MKKKAMAWLMLLYGVMALGGMLLCAFTFGNESLLPATIAGGVLLVIGAILAIVMRKKLNEPDKSSVARWQHCKSISCDRIEDFSDELARVRENYAADTDPNRNVPDIGMKEFKTADNRSVRDTGSIYYAYLVEANTAVFENKHGLFADMNFFVPGVVVYSKDEYYAQNPYALSEIAESLFANRKNNILKNELKRFYNEKFTDGEGRELYLTCLNIFKPFLPDGYMQGSMFPIIADPENCNTVMVVNGIYWTDKLIVNFMNGDAFDPEQNDDIFE